VVTRTKLITLVEVEKLLLFREKPYFPPIQRASLEAARE